MADKNFVIVILVAMILPDALLNRPYLSSAPAERVSTRCAMPIVASRHVSGELPRGLRIAGRGGLEGTPTEPGMFRFTVEISDGCSRRTEQREIRVMPAPVLTAEAETLEFHCPQGAAPFTGGIVRVSGSAPGRAYRVEINNTDEQADIAWLRTEMREGALPDEGLAIESDALRLTIGPGKLMPGLYTARLRISTWQGANTPELYFRLRVDSPQSILAPLVAKPAPIAPRPFFAESPNVAIVAPAAPPPADPPHFPKYSPRPEPSARPTGGASHMVGRSRVLPFPKIVIPPRPASKAVEPAPERTKPSAMPPSAPEPAKHDKPKPAH